MEPIMRDKATAVSPGEGFTPHPAPVRTSSLLAALAGNAPFSLRSASHPPTVFHSLIWRSAKKAPHVLRPGSDRTRPMPQSGDLALKKTPRPLLVKRLRPMRALALAATLAAAPVAVLHAPPVFAQT